MRAVGRIFTVIIAGWLALTVASSAVHAAASDWFEHEHGAVRLVADGATAGSGETLRLGLQFRMIPGWKVYWRSPGDAGFPPMVNWAGSTNFARAEMAWPAPHRFEVLGLQTLGYKKEVLFPITASVLEPGRPVDLKAQVRFLTCDDICVPYEVTLTLALPAGPDINTPEAGLIETWQAHVPVEGADAPLAIERAEIAGTGAARAITVRATAAAPFEKPDVFVEGPTEFGFARPEVKVAAAGTEALFRIAVHTPAKSEKKLAGETVTLKPGGYHVMFMQMKEQLQPDTKRTITLQFEKAGTIDVDADVLDPAKLQMRMKMKMGN